MVHVDALFGIEKFRAPILQPSVKADAVRA